MAYTWSKEDKFHYDKSEVMKELEKRVVDTVKRAEILQNKIALFESDVEKGNQLLNLMDKVQAHPTNKAADDDIVEETDEVAEDALGLTDDDLENEIVSDLRDLIAAAIKENNIKLAYRIERTIDEILEQDVKCD